MNAKNERCCEERREWKRKWLQVLIYRQEWSAKHNIEKETYQTKKVKYSTKPKHFYTRSLLEFSPFIFDEIYILY